MREGMLNERRNSKMREGILNERRAKKNTMRRVLRVNKGFIKIIFCSIILTYMTDLNNHLFVALH